MSLEGTIGWHSKASKTLTCWLLTLYLFRIFLNIGGLWTVNKTIIFPLLALLAKSFGPAQSTRGQLAIVLMLTFWKIWSKIEVFNYLKLTSKRISKRFNSRARSNIRNLSFRISPMSGKNSYSIIFAMTLCLYLNLMQCQLILKKMSFMIAFS